MLRRVFIEGYKSLGKVELELRPLTVIIGPNAAGKSNLFDALRLLSRLVSCRSLQDAFQGHRGDPLEAFDCSEGGIPGLLIRNEARLTMEVDVELSDQVISEIERQVRIYRKGANGEVRPSQPRHTAKKLLRYRVTLAIEPKTGVLRVQDEQLEALVESENGKCRPDKRRKPFIERVDSHLRLRMEGQARPTDYEIGLNYTLASLPVYPPHYPHLLAFREEVSRWQFYYWEPRLMREESAVREVRQVSAFGGDLAAFYFTLKRVHPGQFQNLEQTLRSLVPTIETVNPELTEEGTVRLKIREGGIEFSAKVISEGTLRILALLAVMSPTTPATLIGLEEPENGVHPRRLKLVADLLRQASQQRQILVNTHSPLLPEHLKDAYLLRCYKEDRHTYFEPIEGTLDLYRQTSVDAALQEPLGHVARRIIRGDW